MKNLLRLFIFLFIFSLSLFVAGKNNSVSAQLPTPLPNCDRCNTVGTYGDCADWGDCYGAANEGECNTDNPYFRGGQCCKRGWCALDTRHDDGRGVCTPCGSPDPTSTPPPSSSTINGRVTSNPGAKSVVNVPVTVWNDTGVNLGSVLTDKDGDYSITFRYRGNGNFAVRAGSGAAGGTGFGSATGTGIAICTGSGSLVKHEMCPSSAVIGKTLSGFDFIYNVSCTYGMSNVTLPNCSEGTYTSSVSGVSGASDVRFATWSSGNPVSWYIGKNLGGENYNYPINSANHKGSDTIFTDTWIGKCTSGLCPQIYCGGTRATRACVPSPTPVAVIQGKRISGASLEGISTALLFNCPFYGPMGNPRSFPLNANDSTYTTGPQLPPGAQCKVTTSVPSGYQASYSQCSNCTSHPISSYQSYTGQFSVTVPSTSSSSSSTPFLDLYFKYDPPPTSTPPTVPSPTPTPPTRACTEASVKVFPASGGFRVGARPYFVGEINATPGRTVTINFKLYYGATTPVDTTTPPVFTWTDTVGEAAPGFYKATTPKYEVKYAGYYHIVATALVN